jgi:hypothetical protein
MVKLFDAAQTVLLLYAVFPFIKQVYSRLLPRSCRSAHQYSDNSNCFGSRAHDQGLLPLVGICF